MIIGLYSPAQQSGKSTVASFLSTDHGFDQRHFALALKRMVIDLMYSAGFAPEEVGYFMDKGKEEPIPELGDRSFRQLTQTIGTDWGRACVSTDLWVDILLKNKQLPDLVVIDDVRFPNEFARIKEAGGQVWRISRPGVVASNEHPSEGLLEGYEFDLEISNDGDLANLRRATAVAIEAY